MDYIVNGDVNSRVTAIKQKLEGKFNSNDIHLSMIKTFVPLAATNGFTIPLCEKYNKDLIADKSLVMIGQNDAFAPVAAKMVVRKRALAGAEYGVGSISSFPDKTIFDATGENAQIVGVYNGSIVNLMVESSNVIHDTPGLFFSFVPNTQSAAATVGATGSLQGFDSYVPLHKDIIISGRTDTFFSVKLAGFTPAAAIIGDTGEQNDIGFIILGFKLRGGADAASEMAMADTKCVYI